MGADAQRASIPIFPLANVVLFPGVKVPLHIFEPRYREMTHDALGGERLIGMVAVREEEADRMEGDPALHPFGCLGTIVGAERCDDGRYDIVLLGTRRFRIEHEPERPASRLYRVAEVTLLDDLFDPTEAPKLHEARQTVLEVFTELVERTDPERAVDLEGGIFEGVEDPVFVNTFCQLLELDPMEKQTLLQADRVLDRCERLETLLRFRLAELSGCAPGGDRSWH
jgi:Lon protease-like protein